MKLFNFAFVLLLCIYTAATQEDAAGKPKFPIGPDSNVTVPTPPSSPKPTPGPTSPKPNPSPTTTPSTTTTVTTPSTTKPTTTAPSSTTSKTTPVPSTTAQPTSTTPSPNPDEPTVGTWNVTKPGTDIKCIMAKMELQIEVEYQDKNTTKKEVVNVPANATANGTCDSIKTNTLSLQWNDKFTDSITFDFVNNTNTSEVSINFIQVVLNGLHTPEETDPMKFFYNRTIFNAPLQHSYKCQKDQSLPLINIKINSTCKATLIVSKLQIEAFRTTNSTDFGDAINCIHSTPDIVPIAVGCALAALVVIVLLAYLYGRRRSQARGYLSM